MLLVLGTVAVAGPSWSGARGNDSWADAGAIVEPIGTGGSSETFDSVLLRAPGGPTSEATVAENSFADDGEWVTDDVGHCTQDGTVVSGSPVTFTEGLNMLCPGLCGHACDCGPLWAVQVDALMLWRSNMQSVPLFVYPDPPGGVALNASQVQPPISAGPRVGVMRRIGACAAIEGNYFNVSPFAGQRLLPATGGPFAMTNFGDLVFNDITTGRLNSNARIQSAELNWRRSIGPAITWLAGFRWVQWNEQMAANYWFADSNPDNLGSGSTTATTANDLYGGQIGVDAILWDRGGPWNVSGVAKAGVFGNVASVNSTAGFVPLPGFGPPYTLPTVSASANDVAFFGEVGLSSTYWLTPWLGWRAGYSLFWMDGVAVAPQQFALANYGSGTTSINTNGSVFLHGVTTGLEARW